MEEKDAGIPRTSKTRSPSYPVVGLERTIEYARDLHKHAKLHEADKATVAGAWKMRPLSGSFLGYSSALKQFRLITSYRSKGRQKYVLTKDAERIVLDQIDSPEKRDATQRAALSPKIYSELWGRFGMDGVDGGIEESMLRNYLVLDRPGARYTPDGARLVVKHYKGTMTFANFQEGSPTSAASETDPSSDDAQEDPERPLEDAPTAKPEERFMQGEIELVKGTFTPDGGFRLIIRGEDFTPRHFKLMLARIILHAEFFGIADPKIIRLADAIISDEVVQPEDWRAGKTEKGA